MRKMSIDKPNPVQLNSVNIMAGSDSHTIQPGSTLSTDSEREEDRGTEEYIKVLKQALFEVASENEVV